MQVRCPKCSATLSLKQAPAGGRVKCPKCEAVIVIGRPGAAQATTTSARPMAQLAGDGEIDFRSLNVPTAAMPSGLFPTAGPGKIYDGPIVLDPIPEAGDAEGPESKLPQDAKAVRKGRKKAGGLRWAIGFIVLLVVCGVGAGVYYVKFGSDATSPSAPASP